MSIVAIAVTFFLVWWTLIFLVVPRSNVRKEEGTAYPDDPGVVKNILATSVYSALLTLAIWAGVRLDIFSFRQWAKHWDQEESITYDQ